MAAFALFIAGTAGLIVLAALNSPDLVTPDYYEQELRHQQTMDSRARAAALVGESAVSYDAQTRRLSLALPPHHARLRPTGTIQLYRPAAAEDDRRIELALDPDGRQELDARALAPGPWRVRVQWTHAGQHYSLERRLVIPPPGR
jgi:nitrogen fixation protein FixH